MKIIGKSEHGLILTATEDEVAHLAGHYNKGVVSTKVGTNIAIDAMWNRLYSLTSQEAKLQEAAKALRLAAELTEQVSPFIGEIANAT